MVKRMTSVSVHVYLIITVLISKTLTFVVTLECDFDKDYCGWQQDEFDDFDWERDSEDHFIYIDAFEKSEGAKSKLISPMQSSGQYCMTFWYSLYGDGIEALNVYIAEPEEKKKVIFAKSDNIFSIKWWKSVLNNNTTDSFQIVLEGVVAKDGSYSYIDINHISIKSGYCSADCDFDDDFCNWMQYHGDDFNWDRIKGETSSSYTGPSADHTSGRGYYTYIETSNRNIHDRAILLSPTQDAGKYCLSFWYYMYGSGIDRLRLQLWLRNSTKLTISTVQSEKGQQWFKKWVLVSSKDMFKIAFEGRVKNDWRYTRSKGDIAIDDVTLFSCNDCKDPRPSHSVANSSNYEYGSVIEIQCKNGYSIEGESVIVCEAMGLWSGSATCIPNNCGNILFPNGNLITPNGTMFGQVGRKVCNAGFILNGEPNVRCTAIGWSNATSHCILVDVETNSSPLIVVYVVIPVVFLMIAAAFTVLYMRRRHLSCMKVLQTFRGAREVPSGDSLQGKSHSNQMYSNENLQLDDEYATISGEQTDDKNLSTVYYATVDRSEIKKSNQTKSTDGNKSACSIDFDEFNTYNVLSAKSALNSNLKGDEEHDLDYDSACTRQIKNEASNHDNYSHIGDLEMKYPHTQHFLPQPDIEKNTDYSHINGVSTSTKLPERLETDYHDYDEYQNPVMKEKKVLEKHTPKIQQLEDQAPDYYNVAQTKEMYERNESKNQRNESENHDYFILEKT